MVKIGFIADVHIGNHSIFGGPLESGINTRCWLVLKTLEKSIIEAKKNDCNALMICGDLFDTIRPSPQIIAATLRILKEFPEIKKYILVGNHEHVSSDWMDHALAPLFTVADIIGEPTVKSLGGVDLLCIPCIPDQASKWFKTVVEDLNCKASKKKVLCFHLGVEDSTTPFFLKGSKDSIMASEVLDAVKEFGIDSVFAGNWHDFRTWDNVYQVGALCPTGFDNPGLEGYGGLMIYDSEGGVPQRVEIPGPRFLSVRHDTPESTLGDSSHSGRAVYVRFKSKIEDAEETRSTARNWLDRRLIAGYDIRWDRSAQEKAAVKAAKVTRKSETMEEAIYNYVATINLPETIDRSEVVARSKKYLKIGD